MAISIPSDTHQDGDGSHTPIHNDLADMAAALTAVVLKLYQHSPALPINNTNNPANATALAGLVGSTVTALLSTQLGVASGVASLDSNSLVPIGQLPVTATSLFLAGSGAPAAGTGLNGDTYEDTATGKVYVKASGAWSQGGTAGWSLLASTGAAGYAMTLAGGTILSWTAPSDGNMHRAGVLGEMIVSTTFAGAAPVNLNFTDPGGVARVATCFGTTQSAGTSPVSVANTSKGVCVQSGSTVTLTQGGSTTGAAVMYLEMWGS